MKRYASFFVALLGAAVGGIVVALLFSSSVLGYASMDVQDFDSYLYLFDANSGDFVYTFTIPSLGASVVDVDVVPGVSHTNVWFTAPGTDQLGHLVYTDTDSYVYRVHDLPKGSYPLNLEVVDEFVWFTMPRRNRIGRLSVDSGKVDEFEVPTEDSFPADLAVASDGSVWFTQKHADQLARLTVDGSGEATFSEYQGPTMMGGRPYGVSLEEILISNETIEAVFVAQTNNDRVTRFLPDSESWLDFYNPSGSGGAQLIPNEPYKLAFGPNGRLWGTGRAGNAIYGFGYGTYAIVLNYALTPANSAPHSLVVDTGGRIWFTQYAAGQLGRLTLGSPAIRDYFPLPKDGLSPTGVDLGENGGVWVLATRVHRVFLPIISKGG